VVEETRKLIQESDLLSPEDKSSIVTNGYGHVGDGNLHLNISLKGYKNEDL
jgi:FAD/FMN-containing dehydrogenase